MKVHIILFYMIVIILLILSSCSSRAVYVTNKPINDLTSQSLMVLCSNIIGYRAQNSYYPNSTTIIESGLSKDVLNYMVIRAEKDKPKPFNFIPIDHPYFSNGVLPRGLIYLNCYLDNGDEVNIIGFSLIYIWPHNPNLFPQPPASFGTNYDCLDWHALVENRSNPRIPNSVFTPDGEEDPVLFKFDYFENYPTSEPDKIYWVWS